MERVGPGRDRPRRWTAAAGGAPSATDPPGVRCGPVPGSGSAASAPQEGWAEPGGGLGWGLRGRRRKGKLRRAASFSRGDPAPHFLLLLLFSLGALNLYNACTPGAQTRAGPPASGLTPPAPPPVAVTRPFLSPRSGGRGRLQSPDPILAPSVSPTDAAARKNSAGNRALCLAPTLPKWGWGRGCAGSPGEARITLDCRIGAGPG